MVEPLFLLDSNVLAEPLKPKPNKRVLEKLSAYQNVIASASIVLHEMRFGLERLDHSKKKSMIKDYIENVINPSITFFPYDNEAASWHAKERARLERKGVTVPFVDAQIAAIAAVNELILVTRNSNDFKHFHNLKTQNWFS